MELAGGVVIVEQVPKTGVREGTAASRRHPIAAWLGAHLESRHSSGTIPVLDGVRAIAALSVVTFHLNLKTLELHAWSASIGPLPSALMLAGSSGVTLFFVLSGLLLFLPYARALLVDKPWPGASMFYLRRALRIIPGYYVSLALLVLIAQPQYLQRQNWGQLALFFLFLNDSTQQTYRQLNGPFWTLAVEWQFYLLLPWIALALYGLSRLVAARGRLWASAGGLVGLMAWGVASRYWGDYFLAHPTASVLVPRGVLNGVLFVAYGQSGKYLEDFAVGMLIGLLYVYGSQHEQGAALAARLRRLSPWLFVGGLLLFTLMAAQLFTLSFSEATGAWPMLQAGFHDLWWLNELGFALAYGACVVAVLYGRRILPAVFAWPPLRWIGVISYSLYIWHLPLILALLGRIGSVSLAWPSLLTYGLFWLWVVLLIIPFSLLMYLLVEKPGMRFSDHLRARWRARRDSPAVAARA
jgi:peptidoglycan/LPS O-acetylase OafA/YrhL